MNIVPHMVSTISSLHHILDSELMNLPDLHAYVKVPNNPSIALSRFSIREYSTKTTSFMIRKNLLLDAIIEKQAEADSAIEDPGFAVLDGT